MRTKHSILSEALLKNADGIQMLILEVLVDIRDGMAQPHSVINIAEMNPPKKKVKSNGTTENSNP